MKAASMKVRIFRSLIRREPMMALAVGVGLAALVACSSTESPSTGSSSGTPGAVTVGLAPAVNGSISTRTSYAAVVEARNQVDVLPTSSGRTEALTVDVGSMVNVGQVVARISHGTLDAQLDQALATLRGSKAQLGSVMAGIEPGIRSAQAKLDSALTAQDQLINPSSSELEAAGSTVATAKGNLDRAVIKLEQLNNPSASDLQTAESALATTQSNLNSANTRLNQLLDPSVSDLQTAQGKVATAQSTLDSKTTNLDQLLNPTAAALAAAQESVSDAQIKLNSAQVKVNDAISDALASASFTASLEQAWESLLSARVNEQANVAILLNPSLSSSLSQDELSDVEASIARYRDSISTQLSAILASSVIQEEVNSPMLAENSEQTALETAQEELKELQSPQSNDIAVARNDVAAAQAALDTQLANLEDLQNADENTVTLARNEVAKASAAVESAQSRLAELRNPTTSTIALAESTVEANQAALAAAEANLQSLLKPTPAKLAAAESMVASAQQVLTRALPPQSDLVVEAAQANLDKAQAQIDLVRYKLEELEVRAPFDGIITRKLLDVGGWAGPFPASPIFTLASTELDITIQVRETEVNSLQLGQAVQFTSPALPGQTLELQVDRIAPMGEGNSFSFRVMLVPTGPAPDLRPGMSGDVAVITQHDNTVLVPKEALLRQAGRPAVYTIQDNRAELRIVGIGLTGEDTVEVRGDILPGENVVISGHNFLREGDLVVIQ